MQMLLFKKLTYYSNYDFEYASRQGGNQLCMVLCIAQNGPETRNATMHLDVHTPNEV